MTIEMRERVASLAPLASVRGFSLSRGAASARL